MTSEASAVNSTTLGIIVSLLQSSSNLHDRQDRLLSAAKSATHYSRAEGILNHTSTEQIILVLKTVISNPRREEETIHNACLDMIIVTLASNSLISLYSPTSPGPFVPDLVKTIMEAIQKGDFTEATRAQLKRVLHRVYFSFVWLRSYTRKLLYSAFKRLHREETWLHLKPIRSVDPQSLAPPSTDPPWRNSKDNQSSALRLYLPEEEQRNFLGIPELLKVTLAIIKGLRQPLSSEYSDKLLNALLPLQAVRGMIDETTPVIALYHSQLTECLLELVKKDPSLNRSIMGSVIAMYPQLNDKQALPFFDLLQVLLAYMSPQQFQVISLPVVKFLTKTGVSNTNYLIALRSTMLLRDDQICTLVSQFSESLFPLLIPALISMAQSMFSNTCREMAYLTLLEYAQHRPEIRDIPGVRELDLHFNRIYDNNTKMEAQKHERMKNKKKDVRLLDFGFGKTLGEGSYSIVKHAYYFDNTVDQRFYEEYAIKIMDKQHLSDQHYQEQAEAEMTLLDTCSHPNMVNLIASFQEESKMYLVLEYVSGGDLFNLLSIKGSLGVEWAACVISQLCDALEYIHSAGWVHMDIKPENILITREGKIKLTDFGSIQKLVDGECVALDVPTGTAEYLAPEVIAKCPFGTPADVWSMGILLYQLVEGRVPFFGDRVEDLFEKILSSPLIFSVGLDFNCRDLVLKMCAREPHVRLNLHQIKAHPLFDDTDTHEVSLALPEVKTGMTSPAAIEPKLKQRKFSMLLTDMGLAKPVHQGTILEAIPEADEKESLPQL